MDSILMEEKGKKLLRKPPLLPIRKYNYIEQKLQSKRNSLNKENVNILQKNRSSSNLRYQQCSINQAENGRQNKFKNQHKQNFYKKQRPLSNYRSKHQSRGSQRSICINQIINRQKSVPNQHIQLSNKPLAIPKLKIHTKTQFQNPPPQITSSACAVFDLNKKVLLYGKQNKAAREVASLTKIMTLVVTIKELQKMNLAPQQIFVTVTKKALLNGTTAFLKQNMKFCLYDLLYGMMLPSGNDAAYTIAQYMGNLILLNHQKKNLSQIIQNDKRLFKQIKAYDGIPTFLQKMNQYSRHFSMSNSFWTNPHGLSKRTNISTPQDICRLIYIGKSSSIFLRVIQTKQYQCYYSYAAVEFQNYMMRWENTNRLLKQGWNGVKTGITPNAGPCLAASYKGVFLKKPFNFCFVILNCQSMQQRWKQMRQLLQWCLQQNIIYTF